MSRVVGGGKNPGAARKEGRKERREDAALIPYLIERQLDSSRAHLREEVGKGDLDRPTRESMDEEARRTKEMARGPCITVDSEEEDWRIEFERDLMWGLMQEATRPGEEIIGNGEEAYGEAPRRMKPLEPMP